MARLLHLSLSLRIKLLLALVVVLVPVLALLLAAFRGDVQQSEQTTLDAQLLTAQAVAVQVDEAFDAAIGVGWAVANDPLSQTMDPTLLDPHLKALVRVNPVYDSINIFDVGGINRGWGNLTEPAEPRLNISDRPYFQEVIRTNRPAISPVLLLRRPVVVGNTATVPIRGADGKPVGVVNVVMRTDLLANRYKEARLRPGQSIFLVDPSGRLAFYTAIPNLPYEQSDAFMDFAPVDTALAGQPTEQANFTNPLTNDVCMGAFVPTLKYHWAVGVSIPRAVALAPSGDQLRNQLLVFGGILLFSIALAILLARLLTEPVRRLQAHARALGRGDLSRRVRINTGDELEHLGDAFNEMAAQLQQRQEEVLHLRAEAEGRARQLAAVIASIEDAVIIASVDDRVVDANPAAQRLIGATDGALIGRPLAEVVAQYGFRAIDGRPLETDETPLARAVAGESFANAELRLGAVGGEERIVNVSGAPVRDEAGRIILGVIVARDVTAERRRAREQGAVAQIARSLVRELELKRVADVVMTQSLQVLGADAVELWLADPERRELDLLAYRNISPEMAERLSHVSYDAPLVTARAARTETIQAVEDLLAAGTAVDVADLHRQEGLRSLLAVPLSSRGRLVGVLTYLNHQPRAFTPADLEFNATVSDLFAVAIENAHLYDAVREALRLREEFIATAAHELRTPVTVIKGWAQLLLMSNAKDAQQRRALETIDRQADRVGRFIEDVLAIANLRPGMTLERREQFDLTTLVRTTVAGMAQTAQAHQFEINANGPLLVSADQRLVTEVLNRLLDNAVRYSPAGGKVTVTVERTDGEAKVTVSDRGFGIPPERQPYVFEPFYQAVPSGAPGYVGLVSLGLHLSKQIVEALGGRIWFTSTPGQGSDFFFTLPLAQ